ncbi:Uncharacterised protein [Ewingella americana]|uniref:Uncharacterized protein n=1 Tax=Ewingella americana TaxID=41202 RepID=A0A377TCX8_9GAMM|nr:Uncharacterised protein [Ewingella americana]
MTQRELDTLKYWRNVDIVSAKVVGVNEANKKIVFAAG